MSEHEIEVVGKKGDQALVRVPREAFGRREPPNVDKVISVLRTDSVDIWVSAAVRDRLHERHPKFSDARLLAAAAEIAAFRLQYVWDVDVALADGAEPTPVGVEQWRSANGVPAPPKPWPAEWRAGVPTRVKMRLRETNSAD